MAEGNVDSERVIVRELYVSDIVNKEEMHIYADKVLSHGYAHQVIIHSHPETEKCQGHCPRLPKSDN